MASTFKHATPGEINLTFNKNVRLVKRKEIFVTEHEKIILTYLKGILNGGVICLIAEQILICIRICFTNIYCVIQILKRYFMIVKSDS